MPHSLRPYQRAGIDFLKALDFAMLGDEPGLGKSAQALTAAAELDLDVVIFCPAIARVSWAQQIEKWFPEPKRASVYSYDSIGLKTNRGLRDDIARTIGTRGVAVILDEAHYLKSTGANRTMAVYGKGITGQNDALIAKAEAVYALSGTFAPNHPGELFPHLRVAGVTGLTRMQFEDRYCNVRGTIYGRQITGAKRDKLPELKTLMKHILLRRRKTDVAQELPALSFNEVGLDVGFKQTGTIAQGIVRSLEEGKDEYVLEALSNPRSITSQALSTSRRELGLVKADAAADWIGSQNFRKVIVFAWHKEVIQRLQVLLAGMSPAIVTGETPHAERARAVDRFQNDPECQVFIGNILAAGTAITLTAASNVVIVEPSYVPGENYQAACRAHRIGQHDAVTVSFLYADDPLDRAIARILTRKTRDIAELFE